jgi:hypothetical protein
MGKDLKASSHNTMKVLSQHLIGGIEEKKNEKVTQDSWCPSRDSN